MKKRKKNIKRRLHPYGSTTLVDGSLPLPRPSGALTGLETYQIQQPATAWRLSKKLSRRYYNRPIPWDEPDPGAEHYKKIEEISGIILRPVLNLWMDWTIESGNRRRMAHWSVKARYTKGCQAAFEAAAYAQGLLPNRRCPKCFAVVRITSQRQKRIEDLGNLAWGAKPLEDCLSWRHCQGWAWIADDSDRWAHIEYMQIPGVKGKGLETGTRVEVWHLVRKNQRRRTR